MPLLFELKAQQRPLELKPRPCPQHREAAGFSLRMLATRSGISPSMISDIERGTKSPTVTTIVRLADALGASTVTLIEGTRAQHRAFAVYAVAKVLAVKTPLVGTVWDPHPMAAASTS